MYHRNWFTAFSLSLISQNSEDGSWEWKKVMTFKIITVATPSGAVTERDKSLE